MQGDLLAAEGKLDESCAGYGRGIEAAGRAPWVRNLLRYPISASSVSISDRAC